ncbi:hypothetical protein BDY24DRAFT_392631 [Mrakia frigida]|uniref:uncharacterized protein n=1 Tax=Mrakia frigida TaxID=29902 RepID=UPI003FCC1FC9
MGSETLVPLLLLPDLQTTTTTLTRRHLTSHLHPSPPPSQPSIYLPPPPRRRSTLPRVLPPSSPLHPYQHQHHHRLPSLITSKPPTSAPTPQHNMTPLPPNLQRHRPNPLGTLPPPPPPPPLSLAQQQQHLHHHHLHPFPNSTSSSPLPHPNLPVEDSNPSFKQPSSNKANAGLIVVDDPSVLGSQRCRVRRRRDRCRCRGRDRCRTGVDGLGWISGEVRRVVER